MSFLNNDPRFAVIIGSLYSKKNKPPFTPENKNKDKAIITKNKLKLTEREKDFLLFNFSARLYWFCSGSINAKWYI